MAEILLIDDDDALRYFLQAALTERGHQVHCLNRADEAMESLTHGEFDLIVVDEVMPGMRGSELLKLLRRQGNDIPVILMTGLGTFGLVDPMKELGALVVPKPAAGSAELMKDLALAVDESLKGEAEIAELIARTVKLALKLGKTALICGGCSTANCACSFSRGSIMIREDQKFLGESKEESRGRTRSAPRRRLAPALSWRKRRLSARAIRVSFGCTLACGPEQAVHRARLAGRSDGKLAADA